MSHTQQLQCVQITSNYDKAASEEATIPVLIEMLVKAMYIVQFSELFHRHVKSHDGFYCIKTCSHKTSTNWHENISIC